MKIIQFFIPGNVPSSKNSKVMGKFLSKTCRNYLQTFGIKSYNSHKKEVIFYKRNFVHNNFLITCMKMKTVEKKEYPIKVGLHLVRGSKHEFDFINACQIIFDLWVAFDLIPDDSMSYIIPYPLEMNNRFFSYDKENPGVYVKILI